MKELGPNELFSFQITCVLVHDLPFAYVILSVNRVTSLYIMCSSPHCNEKSVFLICKKELYNHQFFFFVIMFFVRRPSSLS